MELTPQNIICVNKWWEKNKTTTPNYDWLGSITMLLWRVFFLVSRTLTDCHAADASHEALLMLLEAPEPSQLQEGEWKHLSRRGSVATLVAAQPEIINGGLLKGRANALARFQIWMWKSPVCYFCYLFICWWCLCWLVQVHPMRPFLLLFAPLLWKNELLETHTKQSIVCMCTACTLSQES